jgi:hypothetical protein
MSASLANLSWHVRHERFRCLTRSTPRCVVIKIFSGDKPGLRIEPVVPESTTLLEVVWTFHPDSRLLGHYNLSPFIAQWTKTPTIARENSSTRNCLREMGLPSCNAGCAHVHPCTARHSKHPVWKIRTHDLWEAPFRRRKPEASV